LICNDNALTSKFRIINSMKIFKLLKSIESGK
jgi:hypothetical protein